VCVSVRVCSAGVGRTGTFILIDRLLQHIQHETTIDIFGMIQEMRGYRSNMIQTEVISLRVLWIKLAGCPSVLYDSFPFFTRWHVPPSRTSVDPMHELRGGTTCKTNQEAVRDSGHAVELLL